MWHHRSDVPFKAVYETLCIEVKWQSMSPEAQFIHATLRMDRAIGVGRNAMPAPCSQLTYIQREKEQ